MKNIWRTGLNLSSTVDIGEFMCFVFQE